MNKQSLKKILLVFTLMCLTALMSYAYYDTVRAADEVSGEDTAAPAVLDVGMPAPGFYLPSLDGEMVGLRQFRGKKSVLIEFFATWCPHCQHSVPILEQLHKSEGEKLQILAINAGDKLQAASTAGEFRDYYKIPYPILDRPYPSLLQKYQIVGFPIFFLVDPYGRIAWIHKGALTPAAVADLKRVLKSSK